MHKLIVLTLVAIAIAFTAACGSGMEAVTATPKPPAGKSPTAAPAATSAATAWVEATATPTAAPATATSAPPTVVPTVLPSQPTATTDPRIARFEAIKQDFNENFGTPPFATSWFGYITDISMDGDAVIVRTTLSEPGEAASNICSAVSGNFVFNNFVKDLGLKRMKVLGDEGQLLVSRDSIADRC